MIDYAPLLSISDLQPILMKLPVVSEILPGIGGVLKAVPEHFQVTEVLPYAACGEGEHVFITLKRSGWNTADVATTLGKTLGAKGLDIGWAGLKDKQAVSTQTFSVRMPMQIPLNEVQKRIEPLPFDIIGLERHRNKLKTGHVAANRFKIMLSQVTADALTRAQTIADALRHSGVPNFYGEQRFGMEFRNLERAAALLRRGKARGKKDAFMVSVLQSALFNFWLFERMQRGQFDTLIPGDVARKCDTGGLFTVNDLPEAAQRFDVGRISYTGPIYGYKMMPAADLAAEYENCVLQRLGLARDTFKLLRAPGSRRPAILDMNDLTIDSDAEGLVFSFTLPAGAYATTVMREFTRSMGPAQVQNAVEK